MAKASTKRPVCIVIAGPNGAGKTTFAREFLPKDTRVIHFVNADVIASGLSPLRPELAAVAAGRIFLRELDRLAKSRADFAFESTLSGLIYVHRLKRFAASRPESSRVGIMFRARMYCVVLTGAGRIFKSLIDFSLMPGAYMTIRVVHPGY